MTPLRQRMIRELELQRKAPGTVSLSVHGILPPDDKRSDTIPK